jgi:hypothetical protein
VAANVAFSAGSLLENTEVAPAEKATCTTAAPPHPSSGIDEPMLRDGTRVSDLFLSDSDDDSQPKPSSTSNEEATTDQESQSTKRPSSSVTATKKTTTKKRRVETNSKSSEDDPCSKHKAGDYSSFISTTNLAYTHSGNRLSGLHCILEKKCKGEELSQMREHQKTAEWECFHCPNCDAGSGEDGCKCCICALCMSAILGKRKRRPPAPKS